MGNANLNYNNSRNEYPMNQLKTESSPYLLQHKDNPVAWMPWGDKAFNKSFDLFLFTSIAEERKEQPILL